jgi:hypothetical protein
MVVHTYNPSNQEAEAGGLKVQEQPGLHSKDPSQKKKKKPNKQINQNQKNCVTTRQMHSFRIVWETVQDVPSVFILSRLSTLK